MRRWIILAAFLVVTSCSTRFSKEYHDFYAHLERHAAMSDDFEESEFFLVVLVNARHLDYTNLKSFFATVLKHPSDGSVTGDLGHAWIYLEGTKNNQRICYEVGHSGESGLLQEKYFDGIMNYNDFGYSNPTAEQKLHPIFEPNPCKYLWAVQSDGFYQQGSGGHRPTFAAKIDLSEDQFNRILDFIAPKNYPYQQYALTRHQCCSFVAQVSSLVGFHFDYQLTMNIEPKVYFRNYNIRFWQDPTYSSITLACPDVLEKGLMKAVLEGRAQNATLWYHNRYQVIALH